MNIHINSVAHYTQARSSLGANSGSEFRGFVEDEALLSGWQYEETNHSNLQIYRFRGNRKCYGHLLFKMEYTAYRLISTGIYLA